MTLAFTFPYFGALVVALMYIFSLKNYPITIIAGFITFCVFYFSFGYNELFEWSFSYFFNALLSAVIIYFIAFAVAVTIFKIAGKSATGKQAMQ